MVTSNIFAASLMMDSETYKVDTGLTMGLAEKATRETHAGAETFGERLRRIRESRGYSQEQFGRAIDVSQRMVAYYERHAEKAPAHHLLRMAETLHVSVDELVGNRPAQSDGRRDSRLWSKLRLVETLPPDDRRQITRLIETLVEKESLKRRG